MTECVHRPIEVSLKRMDLDIMQSKDWVSIVDPVLGIGGAGKDYVDAFAAFGRSMHHTAEEWDKQFKEENRAVIVEQDSSRIHPAPDSNTDHDFEGKPRVGRPRAKNSLSGAQRKKLWKQRHGEDALKKEREYQRDYRKRRKAARKYYLEDGKQER